MLHSLSHSGIYTYVDENMMFDNQVERQDEIRKEYYEWLQKGVFDANNKH